LILVKLRLNASACGQNHINHIIANISVLDRDIDLKFGVWVDFINPHNVSKGKLFN